MPSPPSIAIVEGHNATLVVYVDNQGKSAGQGQLGFLLGDPASATNFVYNPIKHSDGTVFIANKQPGQLDAVQWIDNRNNQQVRVYYVFTDSNTNKAYLADATFFNKPDAWESGLLHAQLPECAPNTTISADVTLVGGQPVVNIAYTDPSGVPMVGQLKEANTTQPWKTRNVQTAWTGV